MGLKIKNFLANVLLLFVILILICIVGEFTIRISLYKNENPFRIDYILNSEGFRDYEYIIQKPNKTFRIIALGDSFTFGQGVYKTEDTHPKVLEKLLNKNNYTNYEVFNFGQRGYNTKNELDALREQGLKYKPDLVIVNFYIDDADFDGYKSENFLENRLKELYPSLERQNKRFPHFYYFILKRMNQIICQYKFLKCKNYCIHLKEVYSSENWKKEKGLLKEIEELGKKNDFKTAIVIFPILNNQVNKTGLKETYCTIQKELEQEGFPVLNLYYSYDKYDFKSLWINAWDSHPNEKGHEIAAKAIYNFLIRENLLLDTEDKVILPA